MALLPKSAAVGDAKLGEWIRLTLSMAYRTAIILPLNINLQAGLSEHKRAGRYFRLFSNSARGPTVDVHPI
jgi:hypothetical protein